MERVDHFSVNGIPVKASIGCFKIFLIAIIVIFFFMILPFNMFLQYYTHKAVSPVLVVFFVCGIFFLYRVLRKKKPVSFSKLKPTVIDYSQYTESLVLNNNVPIWNPYAGVFICGGAGSGKSKSAVEPIIKDAGAKNYTGVVYDFKFPVLAGYVESAYQGSAIKRYYIDFTNIDYSNRVNPIAPELMKNASYAREFAFSILANLNKNMITKPDFWTDNSLTYLSAVFWFLRTEYPQFCTLPHAISLVLNTNYEALISLLRTNAQTADMVAPIGAALDSGAQNQLAGVISSLQVSLSKINTPEVYYITSSSDFSLNLNNPEDPGILTIGNDPTLSSTYSPIIGLMLTSISKQLNQKGKLKSMFLIDEFPTVFIPGVEQLPATARSNRVATILACQDIAQMTDMYGKEKSETVLSNLGNQFFGRTTNPQTAERVSKIFGKADKLMQSTSDNFSGSLIGDMRKGGGVSYSYQERELVKIQDVATLNTGEFYVILSEGNMRQGKAYIPLDPNFQKSDLKANQHVTEAEMNALYNKIRFEANELLT